MRDNRKPTKIRSTGVKAGSPAARCLGSERKAILFAMKSVEVTAENNAECYSCKCRLTTLVGADPRMHAVGAKAACFIGCESPCGGGCCNPADFWW